MRNSLAVIGLILLALPASVGAQTKGTDPMPPFNLAYFAGTWTFEWTVPDTILGPGGDVVGTVTYTVVPPPVKLAKVSGFVAIPAGAIPEAFLKVPVVEGRMTGDSPDGPIKTRLVMAFNPETRAAVRVELPATGAALIRTGSIGGDLGGVYSWFWESTPARRGKDTIQLQGRLVTFSPGTFRDYISHAPAGGTFKTLGQPFYEKQRAK